MEKRDDVRATECKNHPPVEKYSGKVEEELKYQIHNGCYKVCESKPIIVSPLGAIPKDNADIRIIHDCSRPTGNSLNDYAIPSSVHYENLERAYELAGPGMYMCKVDLKSAYRSVAIHPDDYLMTGFQFKFAGESNPKYMYDVRLPFGCKKGPMIFHRLSQSVKRMMIRRGYDGIVVYLDDFLCVADSFEKCREMQCTLISLLIQLGFCVSWEKIVGPSQCIQFLGVLINTVQCSASLSDEKMRLLVDKLSSFQGKRRASKRQLQSLAGSLNWACQVIRGGRFFLRRILDSICKLKQQSHKCILSVEFHKDLQWWLEYSQHFNGTIYYRQTERVIIHTDACNVGAGMFCAGDWQYVNWEQDVPEATSLHINYHEVLAAVFGVRKWAHVAQDCDIIIITDSTVAKSIINKGRCKNGFVNEWLRSMFWTMTKYNLRVRAIHIPDALNQLPDAISRLHEPGQILRLYSLLSAWYHSPQKFTLESYCNHMSPDAFQVVLPQLIKWISRLN